MSRPAFLALLLFALLIGCGEPSAASTPEHTPVELQRAAEQVTRLVCADFGGASDAPLQLLVSLADFPGVDVEALVARLAVEGLPVVVDPNPQAKVAPDTLRIELFHDRDRSGAWTRGIPIDAWILGHDWSCTASTSFDIDPESLDELIGTEAADRTVWYL